MYMYLVSSQMPRISSLAAMLMYNEKKPILVSEIALYPLGFALLLDKPKDFTPAGTNIDNLASYNYDEKCQLTFTNVPYLDLTSRFPLDYRTKDEIIKAIETNGKKRTV